jgi:hypothetical protein
MSTNDLKKTDSIELDLYCPEIWKSDKDSRQEQVDMKARNSWGSQKKHNPYGRTSEPVALSVEQEAERALDAARTGRKAPDEKGYTWSMGYNHLSGRYSPGGRYSELTGSSLNRNKQLKLEFREKQQLSGAAKLAQVTKDLVTVVLSFAQKCRKIWGCIPQKLIDLFSGEVQPSDPEFKDWFSRSIRGSAHGLSFGVHLLSPRSRGKIKDKATAFFRATSGDRVFCTLTFVAPVDDKTGVSILNKFLVQCRKKFTNFQYFWVAERQENGNIHFHTIMNKRLPVGRWNALWVLQQYNAGLVGQDRFGNEISNEEVQRAYLADQAEGFKKKRIQELLNPLDIKKVRSIAGLSSYLTKYITKQKKDQYFNCSVWHCSRRVSRMFTRQTVGPSAFGYMKSFSNCRVDRSTGEITAMPMELKVANGFCVIIYALDKAAPLRYLKRLEQANKWILQGLELDGLPELDDGEYRKHFVSKN